MGVEEETRVCEAWMRSMLGLLGGVASTCAGWALMPTRFHTHIFARTFTPAVSRFPCIHAYVVISRDVLLGSSLCFVYHNNASNPRHANTRVRNVLSFVCWRTLFSELGFDP